MLRSQTAQVFRDRLLAPWPARSATIVTVVGALVLFLVLDRTDPMRRDAWNVDEGQRIAESYFVRLLEERAFDHPDWFRVVTDSSHPQMSKFFFGIALQLQGAKPPRDLALPRYYESGGLDRSGWRPPPHLMKDYAPLLLPARRAALACNVVSWMAITWLLLRCFGGGAALVAAFVFTRHYLPVTLFAHARSDALQACAFTLTLLPLAAIWRGARGRAAVAAAILIGICAAVAFQTRLNGLLALGGAATVLLAITLRERNPRALRLLLLAILACFSLSIVSNPYYWAKPRPAPGLPAVYLEDEALPLRVATRFRLQVTDLGTLLDHHRYAELASPAARVGFVAKVLSSGVAGLVLLGGIIAALVALLMTSRRDATLFSAVWTLSVGGVFALWLPLAWEPYILIIFPSAVLFAAGGWHAMLIASTEALRTYRLKR